MRFMAELYSVLVKDEHTAVVTLRAEPDDLPAVAEVLRYVSAPSFALGVDDLEFRATVLQASFAPAGERVKLLVAIDGRASDLASLAGKVVTVTDLSQEAQP